MTTTTTTTTQMILVNLMKCFCSLSLLRFYCILVTFNEIGKYKMLSSFLLLRLGGAKIDLTW